MLCASCTSASGHGDSALDDADVPSLQSDVVSTSDVPFPTDSGALPSTLRPIAPLSTSTVSSQRPTLQWTLPPGVAVAQVQLCRDRACNNVIAMLTGTTSVRPAMPLPAGWVFWRVRSGQMLSPTWQFWVPSRSADADRDTSFGCTLDANGDGHADLAVGAREFQEVGHVLVFHGSGSGFHRSPDAVLSGNLSIPGSGEKFGSVVSTAGDVNGDGFVDLLVGAPRALPAARRDGGAAYLFLGSPSGYAPTPALVITGLFTDERLGSTVAALGDLNADGYADFAVGSSRAAMGSSINAGRVAIFLGGPTASLVPSATAVITGENSNDRVGSAITALGDSNGDGIAEFAVGASDAMRGADVGVGFVRTYTLSRNNFSVMMQQEFVGSGPSEFFGFSLAGAGDLNGDGYGDLVIGAPGATAPNGPRAGAAIVYLGSPTGLQTRPDARFFGSSEMANFGYALSMGGDMNGDGFDDLLVGARTAQVPGFAQAGLAALFQGRAMLAPANTPTLLNPTTATTNFGRAVALVGDSNGDRLAEIAIASPDQAVMGMSLSGQVQIHAGSAQRVNPAPTQTFTGTGANEYFGYSVAE